MNFQYGWIIFAFCIMIKYFDGIALLIKYYTYQD